MRAVVQRVSRAKVTIDDRLAGEIEKGLVVLLGVARDDSESDARHLAAKIVSLRIFDDEAGKMNRSVRDIGGGVLVISQFTLYGDVRRGLRPSWIEAAAPEAAKPLYEFFIAEIKKLIGSVSCGSFRSMMQVELVNDGPVTILLDSRKQF
ncbi:MAG TPA: D-aminoacyl-tRNA deacylase [Pyrinomonadaceae bacterium]|jgi:D-tyrosyl-tRNA(Tyr) deacylase|nr:D-aminoacyl-tRNA deacylase [Pyrinomonadaceae bacterium]